jgi:hypothetical protein
VDEALGELGGDLHVLLVGALDEHPVWRPLRLHPAHTAARGLPGRSPGCCVIDCIATEPVRHHETGGSHSLGPGSRLALPHGRRPLIPSTG